MDKREEKEIKDFNRYLVKLSKKYASKSLNSRNDAISALKRTGVVNRNGEAKKKKVSWG